MKPLRIILIIITFLILLTSYRLSDQTDTASLKRSDWVLEKLHLVKHEDILNESGNYSYYSRLIREVAHVLIYILITLSIYLMLYAFTRRAVMSVILTFIIVILYAFYDEYHQESIKGRGYEWLDLVLDFIGCTICLFVISAVTVVNRYVMRNKN